MNIAKQDFSNKRQELLEKKKLSQIVSDWVTNNKKVFWKYEVSSYYKTYMIKITNLPEPSVDDIILSADKRLLSIQQKKQLSDAITKACSQKKAFNESSIDVEFDYDNGIVIAEVR